MALTKLGTARLTAILMALFLAAAGCTGATRPEAAKRSAITGDSDEPAPSFAPGDVEGLDPADPNNPNSPAAGDAANRSSARIGQSGGQTGGGGGGGGTGGGGTSGAGGTQLFNANENTVGISKDQITLCAHAALTYGAAFNTSADDLNVYWTALSDEKNGIFGRRVHTTYENDNYQGEEAIKAAERCKAKNPFFIIGGIGFDQIPSVRDWAERNRMLYMHHTATIEGTEGQQFSFSGLPTTEKTGEMFAELALWKFRDKDIGIIARDSTNWDPGLEAFKKKAAGRLNIVAERKVVVNQHNYSLEVAEMEDKGAEVVWAWENALLTTEIVQQAKSRGYSPTWMAFPFNLTSQTLGDQAINPPMYGVAMFNGYSYQDYSGEFAKYADDMKEFERQYRKYRPNVDLRGVAGDLLFLNWQGQKGIHGILNACGPDCTRNKLVDTIKATKQGRNGAVCGFDFTRGDPFHGGYEASIMQTYKTADGKVNWRNIVTCAEHVG